MTVAQEQPVQTPEEDIAQRGFPEFESAIKRKAVSFPQFATAYFYAQPQFNPNQPTQRIYERYYPSLLEGFEAEHGAITELFWCSNIVAAAVLTDRDEIHTILNLEGTQDLELEIKILAAQCERLHGDAQQLLKDRDRRRCAEMIYSVLTYALGISDSEKKLKETDQVGNYARMLDHLKGELAHADEYYRRCTQRNAQFHYFVGMMWGLLSLVPLTALIGFGISRISISGLVLETFLGSLIAGGVGAVVSVMSRLTFGRLSLSYEAGFKLLQLVGSFRPVIGSIFGLIIYILLASGILPIAEPEDAAKKLYFYSAIAFIAGFSERWAQDMLVVARSRISPDAGSASPPTQPAPATGPPPPR